MQDMTENITVKDDELTKQNKVISLFQFIEELNKLKQTPILDYKKNHIWHYELSNLPNDPDNIQVFYQDRVEDDESEPNKDNILLVVHKPEFTKCPEPEDIFKEWLIPGWEDYRNDAEVKSSLTEIKTEDVSAFSIDRDGDDSGKEIILFEADPNRVSAFEKWNDSRNIWCQKQKITEATRDLFSDLYSLYFELQRESETEEMIVANGIILDKENGNINHPVLTHRVKLEYDANENTIYIINAEVPSELYSSVFQVMEDVNLERVDTLNEDLQNNDYHPLDRNDTPIFLKTLIHSLSSESTFSDSGIPDNWKTNSRLLLYISPCYIIRKRLDGTIKAIDQIIGHIKETGEVPAPINDIVCGGTIDVPENDKEESIEELLAAVGGESVDILLSKEANKEQLEIARRIERYNAVLVQGPPGTGKTHTIANLMGHFLAQGKSVLVTSQTTKALKVLKEKIYGSLQNLCVSILDDSNVDMERSIDGITTYMSDTTSHALKKEMDSLAIERRGIINELAKTRKKIFEIINTENDCIVYNGESISPSKAAEFVVDHMQDLSYIPGKVKLYAPLPLTFDELTDLYRSNEAITQDDETELATDLPDPKSLMSPGAFINICHALWESQKFIKSVSEKNGWKVNADPYNKSIVINGLKNAISMPYPSLEAVEDLKSYVDTFGTIENWMKAVAIDGKRGGNYKQRWLMLIEQIQKTKDFADSIISEQLGINIETDGSFDLSSKKPVFEKLRSEFEKNGKISAISLMLHKDYREVLDSVKINGNKIQSTKEIEVILHKIELNEYRDQCANYWNDLLSPQGISRFYELDTDNQEMIADKYIRTIKRYLEWYDSDYIILADKLRLLGIPKETVLDEDELDPDATHINKALNAIDRTIPDICEVLSTLVKSENDSRSIKLTLNNLTAGKRGNSQICKAMVSDISGSDTEAYSNHYAELSEIYSKNVMRNRRSMMLKTLDPVAPEWADAIRKREGMHGQFTVPDNIEDAWKWKQFFGIIEDITKKPLSELQSESLRLGTDYRKITALYAEKSAWYHLLNRTEHDIDMKQALIGWKQTVKKIGKGTGKRAPALKAKARELMTKCQNAVPGWIMPINRALESLDPRENRFDIIIIDEASQSDISSLAILYMGKKLIIVGDDKQVSPMAVGMDVLKMSSLEQMYIKDKIPNSHLYNSKTSIYDIAATTFQPLMLREHFRCVPEIIGFSNMLSYDYKIKPLRDASQSILQPAVVNYRVENGKRDAGGKTNTNEAKAIIALIKACLEQPEYDNKSIGVISLLGDEQVKVISRMIEQEIDPVDISRRNILCGNSANFQGDERDVIFLSLVDSGDGNGPIRMLGSGTEDAIKKRYNVAVSRARDQLWVVDSLDPAIDLKPGDMRKILIDYSLNPTASAIRHDEIESKSESPFEVSIATALSDRGYHIEQQWEVGAYRLDMVAVCEKNMVAIECDGERWHSGEAKIREDMERQTILERLGWRFIRIRGSEYYRYPEKTIERVISDLTDYGIYPEDSDKYSYINKDTDLLSRVKNRAAIILYGKEPDPIDVMETVAEALNPTELINPKVDEGPTEITENLDKEMHEDNKKVIKKTGEKKYSFVEQLTIPGLYEESSDEIIKLLKESNVKYIDKRNRNGALWILGGPELQPVVNKAKKLGFTFIYKEGGGKVTKGKNAWWCKK